MKHILLIALAAMTLVGCGNDKIANDRKADGAPKTSVATDTPNTVRATASAPVNK